VRFLVKQFPPVSDYAQRQLADSCSQRLNRRNVGNTFKPTVCLLFHFQGPRTKRKLIPVLVSYSDRTPVGDLCSATSTVMSEFKKDELELRGPVPNITHPTAVSDRVTGTKLTFVPQERMDSYGQAICHASITICLLSRDAAA
jgi:hypothetical protein